MCLFFEQEVHLWHQVNYADTGSEIKPTPQSSFDDFLIDIFASTIDASGEKCKLFPALLRYPSLRECLGTNIAMLYKE